MHTIVCNPSNELAHGHSLRTDESPLINLGSRVSRSYSSVWLSLQFDHSRSRILLDTITRKNTNTHEVSELTARFVDPQPGERISDPACGSGSLLIKCGRQVEGDNYMLYGQENNGTKWAWAVMNMFLHDVSNAKIEWGDTLHNPLLLEGDDLMTFDVVVANPAFAGQVGCWYGCPS